MPRLRRLPLLLLHLFDFGRYPDAVEYRFFSPIAADIEREHSFRRRKRVRFLVLAGGLRSCIEGERTVRIVFKRLVFRAE